VLLELLTMRMCGHAHHDDMLYLGHEPELGLRLPKAKPGGYVDIDLYEQWQARDPIACFEKRLIDEKIITKKEALQFWQKACKQVDEAVLAVSQRAWPEQKLSDDELTLSCPYIWLKKPKAESENFNDARGITCLKAIAKATQACFIKYDNCYVLGQDVAPPYGNVFMLYKEVMDEFPNRFINTPISENAIVGSCVGLALAGMRPIGEIQFNDFIACAMDQLVNNAAKSFYRLNSALPMVLRLPYGGMRRAGPYHSQDTSPWFYRTAGLKIMAPSNPVDCYFLLQKAVDDNDPVLFYEHIALYRDPSIKQIIPSICPDLNGARLVKSGNDITIITYGAMVYRALASSLIMQNTHNINAEIIDLRYLKPIDLDSCYESIKKTSRVLLLGEDSRIGSILQSIAAEIAEHCFYDLDAPPVVLGSRNTPVPYSPALEDDYLLSDQQIIDAALKLRIH
jgi:2-oxoisovalerate dehydrogenase E1 component